MTERLPILPESVRSDPPGLEVDGAGAVARRRWMYPREIAGPWTRKRQALMVFVLLPLYFVTPFLRVDGVQAVLFDLPGRKLTVFGHHFFPQDGIFLWLMLMGSGLALFFFTSLWGRIWCGFACPQTVFIETLFRPLEVWLEGDARERRLRDEGPHGFDWLWRKVVKHAVYVVFAHAIALTFVAYFYGTDRLYGDFKGFHVGHVPFWFTTVFAFLFWFDFAIFREQFCMFVCPYARFQGVLMDADSLVVGYDVKRGEPRGSLRAKDAGDCIDCRACVAVCPTGIDIRHGNQLECISCARCIDACDEKMLQVKRAPGLIRFDAEKTLVGGEPGRRLRPRPLVYGVALLVVGVVFAVLLAERPLLDLTVLRQPSLTISLPDGRQANPLTLKIMNKDNRPHRYLFRLEGDGELVVSGAPLDLESGARATLPALVIQPEGGTLKTFTVVVESEDDDAMRASHGLRFLQPGGPEASR